MKLVMTLLVRDEADILRLNLEHHLAQGIDHFIVTDNRSVDSTPVILEEYSSRGLLSWIHEPSETYDQALWVTRMAERAASDGADWVIHADADEFWIAREPGQTLRDVIEVLPAHQPVQIVKRWNAALHRRHDRADWIDPVGIRWFDAASENNLGQPLPPKVLHRGRAGVRIDQGNHGLAWPDPSVELNPCEELIILHFPYRGYSHYAQKIQKGGRSYSANPDLPDSLGKTWRSDYLHWMGGRLQRLCRQRLPRRLEFQALKESGRLKQAPNGLPQGVDRGLEVAASADVEAEEGVICLADNNYFCGVRLLYHSLEQKRPLTVYDLGLNGAAKRWIEERPCITVRSIPQTPLVQAIRQACGDRTMAKPTKREWPLWICPELILDAPYQRVAWIDADAIVLRGVESLFDLIRHGPVVTPENLAPEQTANPIELLQHLPLSRSGSKPVPEILLNAGVSGWCLERDRALLEAYTHPIRCIFQGQSVPREAVRWHDQGCLIWALQNAGHNSSLLQDPRWNLCVKHSALSALHHLDRQAEDPVLIDWLEQARGMEPDACIVHWNGHPVPWD